MCTTFHPDWPRYARSGSALLSVMIVVFIVSMTAGAFYAFSSQNLFQAKRMTDAIHARAIAEAGANEAVSQLIADYTLRQDAGNFLQTDFGGGAYHVTLTNSEGRCIVMSRGTFGTASQVIGIELRDLNREEWNGGTNDPPTWRDFALFANGDLTFNGSPTVIGDVHTNNRWDLNGVYSSVNGMVSALNATDIPEAYRATWQLVPFPSLSDPDFQAVVAEARANGTLTEYFGNQSFKKDQALSGIVIVHGDLTFIGSGVRTVNGLLYVTGDVTANGSGTMTLQGALLAGGNISFNGVAGVFSHASVGEEQVEEGGQGEADADTIASVKVYATWQGGQ